MDALQSYITFTFLFILISLYFALYINLFSNFKNYFLFIEFDLSFM